MSTQPQTRPCCHSNPALQYTKRKPRRQKPTAHISYDEGLHLIRSFLNHASHHTVEELQAFTSQWVPHPRWVKVDSVTIPDDHVTKAADVLIQQLGHNGINHVGGSKWWQWRRKGGELKAEWIEMRGDCNARKMNNDRGRRVMLYVHGGAYFFGSVDEHRYQMQRHARKLRARVFAPRYRLAPQFPFPCGLQDCLAAYLYLLSVQEPSDIILAGDSAGGGMVVSILVMLRDRGLPLPAGAILISPWVDPTHSFPSVADKSDFDYIPAHGFMQKPSASWPPPNDDEIQAIAEGAVGRIAGERLPGKSSEQGQKSAQKEAIQGFAVYHQAAENEATLQNPNNLADESKANPRACNTMPGPGHQLSIELDGKLVILKDQIQMYTTNQLLSHPLVAPVLQPSLGGLPPLLVLTGGGEILRDEQIYLAHKAANPEKYPPGDAYLDEYDPDRSQLHKYKPTHVQLQVWDDLCHVAPTLSFTRPAKYMYRSVSQFGAWALARAQNTSIEITDDDDVSVISNGSHSDTETTDSAENLAKMKIDQDQPGEVGKAGDPLPAFKNHMIRQRVDRHGVIYPLAPANDLPGLQMRPADVGVIKPGPVRKWLAAKKEWDTKYAREKRRVQQQRVQEMATGGTEGFGAGEQAPPSAMAGRRKEFDLGEEKKKKKSYGLMLWSMFGSKHDEHTIQREESRTDDGRTEKMRAGVVKPPKAEAQNGNIAERDLSTVGESKQESNLDKDNNRSRSRRRTITVTDAGQTEGWDSGYHKVGLQEAQSNSDAMHERDESNETDNSLLAPRYYPAKFKNKNLDHLKDDERASVTTSGGDVESLANASTTAVFAAPGLLSRERKPTNASNLSGSLLVPGQEDENVGDMRSEYASTIRPDTPVSTRSNERLQSHQDVQLEHLRSPSTVAVMQVPGVVGVVDGDGGAEDNSLATQEKAEKDNEDAEIERVLEQKAREAEERAEMHQRASEQVDTNGSASRPERPGMYDRSDTEFKTAMEVL